MNLQDVMSIVRAVEGIRLVHHFMATNERKMLIANLKKVDNDDFQHSNLKTRVTPGSLFVLGQETKEHAILNPIWFQC